VLGEFDGIGEQVEQHLAQTQESLRHAVGRLSAICSCRVSFWQRPVPASIPGIRRAGGENRLDPEHAGIHFRVIEDVVDDAQSRWPEWMILSKMPRALLSSLSARLPMCARPSMPCSARTDLMTHVGQEFALHPGQALRFVACRLESSRSCFDQVFEMVPVLFEFGSHRLALGNIGDETMPQRFALPTLSGAQ
jgi:hypothetical protein